MVRDEVLSFRQQFGRATIPLRRGIMNTDPLRRRGRSRHSG
jgi:hypothetical protein